MADGFSEEEGNRRLHIAMAVGGVLLVFLLLFFWRSWRTAAPPPAAPPPTVVNAIRVVPQTVPDTLDAVGSLKAVQQVTLSPQAAGDVVRILFGEGARVEAGTLLVQLNDKTEKADRAAAVAKEKFARLQLERARRLVASGAESREILQQREAEENEARAAVAQIDAQIENLQVVAPFTGVLGIRQVNLGQYLSPGDPVVTLTDLKHLYADFTLPQQALPRIRTGAEVQLGADSFPGRVFHGKVVTIEPQIGTATRNILVRALFPNPGQLLRPGMYVEVGLVLPASPDAVILPLTAIVTSSSGSSAVVIRGAHAGKEGQAVVVPLTLGRRLGSSVVVESGLKAGDVVVAEGQIRVQPGARIKVKRLTSTTVPVAGPPGS